MLGEVLNRKNRLVVWIKEAETGLWSTPFCYDTPKNSKTQHSGLKIEIFNYLPPAKKDEYTKIDLRNN